MARAWIYDRSVQPGFAGRVKKAKAAGRKPPARWMVMYYDRANKLRSEIAANKAAAETRRDKIAESLAGGTYVDPNLSKAKVSDMAEKWLASRTTSSRAPGGSTEGCWTTTSFRSGESSS